MEMTLTNNFYSYFGMILFGNNTALGVSATNTELSNWQAPLFHPMIDTDNETRNSVWFSYTSHLSMGSVSSTKSGGDSQLRFDIGSSNSPASKTDHALVALDDTSYTVSTDVTRYVEDGVAKVRYDVTVTAVSNTITFSEIGMFKRAYGMNVGIVYDFLLGRLVVPETTLTAGNSKIFNIDVVVPA